MHRQSWFWLVLALLLLAGDLRAAESSELPMVLRAVEGEPCEQEGWTGSRNYLDRAIVHGRVIGIEGVDGPKIAVEPSVVFPEIDPAGQGWVVEDEGRFRSSAVFMRGERISCKYGRFVVKPFESLPEVEVRAPGCAPERLRLEAREVWIDIELQCSFLRRSV